MTRFYRDMKATFSTTVKQNGVLTDTPTITFIYKSGLYGTETAVTPSRQSTGTYSATITPADSGNLYYRWDTDGTLDVAQEGVVNIAESAFT